MKRYNSRLYARIDYALNDCNNHQDWNVINIYPTGWRHEVCVVYYTCIDASKQEWKPTTEHIKALMWVMQNIPYNIHKENLSGLLEQLKKLKEG